MMINRILVMAKRERKDRQLQKLEAQEKRCRKEKNRQTKRDMYETEEGCLSLDGVRKTTRYQEIEVEYYDFNWKKQRQKLSGWTAQICQHEIDHLSGKII